MKKVAVILCGSGHRDGSEIRESVASLWAISSMHAHAQCFAPNRPQAEVINFLTNQIENNSSRNMLQEAARIARGDILPLTDLTIAEFDALLLPGGFGAAKNLCTFASEGSKGKVIPELQTVLQQAYQIRKPIGAICIAPAILALAFPNKGFKLTLGEAGETAQEIEKLGHRHVPCPVNQCVTDYQNRVVTTPAYMYGQAELRDIFEGIQKLVHELSTLA